MRQAWESGGSAWSVSSRKRIDETQLTDLAGTMIGDAIALMGSQLFPSYYSGSPGVTLVGGSISGSGRYSALFEGNCAVPIEIVGLALDENADGDVDGRRLELYGHGAGA